MKLLILRILTQCISYTMTLIDNTGSYNIVNVKYVNLAITKIMYGVRQIWSIIKSCFGSGTWIPTSLWIRDDLWKNN